MPDDKEIDEILNEIKNNKEKDSTPAESEKEMTLSEEPVSEPTETENEVTPDDELELVESEPERLDDGADNITENNTITAEPASDEINIMDTVNDGDGSKPQSKSKIIIIAVAVALIVAACVGVFAYMSTHKSEPETTSAPTTTAPTTTQAPIIIKNPLTNEDDFNISAVDKRPAALVVENAPDARPQWGMDDDEHAPDIILEGEVEGGVTRTLWFFADYTALPSQVGPMRSARPPFIKFSQLFDSIFIHWGQSASKGDYIGADTVFSQDNVDHINQMAFSDSVGLFGRDKSRNVSSEHTGVVYGDNLAAAIESQGFRTEANKSRYTMFSFNSEDKPVGTDACTSVTLTYSSRSTKSSWSYNAEDGLYYTDNYRNNVSRKNLLILFDDTQYVVKDNYKNGKSETYCNYALSGGSGRLISMGTVADINWEVQNGVIVLTDENGNSVNLNTGKTWIGWASANNGGSVYYE